MNVGGLCRRSNVIKTQIFITCHFSEKNINLIFIPKNDKTGGVAFRLGPRDRDVVRVANRKNRIRLLRETSALRSSLAGRSRRPLRLLLDCGKVCFIL